MNRYKKYNKKEDYTYTLGAFPTWELINSDYIPEMIYIDDRYIQKDELISKLNEKNIPYKIASKQIEKLSDKNNVYLIGFFKKKNKEVLKNKNHVVLHNISDMGNLGTIIRTMLAFEVKDLVLIGNVADIYNPKVIRASMGAIFKIRFSFFESMEDYLKEHKNNIYLFMLSDRLEDSIYNVNAVEPYSIIMGNEGSGLPKEFEKYGKKIFIPQSNEVDSLNLPIATSIGLYEFRRNR